MESNNTVLTNSTQTSQENNQTNQTNEVKEISNTEKASIFNELLDSNGKFVKDWQTKLPEGLKEAKSLTKFNSPTEIMTSYLSLEKEFSKRANEKIVVPGDDASDEEWTAFKEKIGANYKPEDYDINKPEDAQNWNEKLVESAKSVASKYGISKKAMKELVNVYDSNMKEMLGVASEQESQKMQSVVSSLKSEWKDEYSDNINKAVKAATILGLDPQKPEIGNNPEIIKALLKVHSLIGTEDSLVKGEFKTDTIKDRYDKIMKSDDYLGKNGIQNQMKAAELLKNLYNAMNQK